MRYDVFISYSRWDKVIADNIYKSLSAAGVTCFIDRADIGGGREFIMELTNAIDNSSLLLFLGSKNSYESSYASREVNYAFNAKKIIVPYLIDNTTLPKDLEFIFETINIRNIKQHPVDTVLVEDILRLLGKRRYSKDSFTIKNKASKEYKRPVKPRAGALKSRIKEYFKKVTSLQTEIIIAVSIILVIIITCLIIGG